MTHTLQTPTLDIAYEAHGPADGPPVVLLHGFPYSIDTWHDVAPALAATGRRVIVPHLRGHGPTRFLSASTPRSGQQAALGADVRDLLNGLDLRGTVLAGYDWGGRGACIAAALWPERVAGLVTIGGYNIQDIAGSVRPGTAAQEHRYWYQYYFHTARGEAGLRQNRREIVRLLWQLWSPGWTFGDAGFDRSAPVFDNPDWVDVVLQSYRHRFGYAPGDPALEPIEAALALQPVIDVPTIILEGAQDGVAPPTESADTSRFGRLLRRSIIAGAGHNMPQERPEAVIQAVLDVS